MKQKFKDSDSSYQNHLCNDVKNKVLHPFYNFLTMEIRISKFIETHLVIIQNKKVRGKKFKSKKVENIVTPVQHPRGGYLLFFFGLVNSPMYKVCLKHIQV